MNLRKGLILVKADVPEEVVTSSGIVIPIKQQRDYAGAKNYNEQKYAPTHGHVLQSSSDSIKLGDKVLFHYNTELTCKRQGAVYEGGLIIEADKIVAIMRDGTLLPTTGWVIAKRAEKPKESEGSIYIPEAHRTESDKKFIVVAVADGYDDVLVGQTIYTEKDCDIPLQTNEYFGIVDTDLFKIKTENILAVVLNG